MVSRKLPAGMFGSEAELCELLAKVARASGFAVHSEVGDWDQVLVSRETGQQCGVQAKLRPNLDVLDQAIEHERHAAGPEVHAVLVPVPSRALLRIAAALDVLVIQGVTLDRFDLATAITRAPRWQHKERLWVPEVEVITPAGVASPRKVTQWKLNAVKLCMLCRAQGYITSSDMRRLEQSRSWWFMRKAPMLIRVPSPTRQARYELADPSSPLVPDLRWPEIVEALQLGERCLQQREARECEIIERFSSQPLPPQSPIPPPADLEPERTVVRGRPRIRVRASGVQARQSILPPPMDSDLEPMSEPMMKPPANARIDHIVSAKRARG